MGKRILVVDDEADLLMMLEARLSASGYEIVTAQNGVEGLQKVKEEKPDLIITDVMMPEMDGYEFYKRLQADDSTNLIPVIVLTARGKMQDTFLALGAQDFVPKPFDANVLLGKVSARIGPGSVAAGQAPKEEPPPQVEEKIEEKVQEKPAEEPQEKPAEPVQERPPEPVEEKPTEPMPAPEVPAEQEPQEPEQPEEAQPKFQAVVITSASKIVEKTSILLAKRECAVHACMNSADACAKAQEVDPQFIFCDVLVDGIQTKDLVKKIRKVPQLKTTPIVLFSFLDKDDPELSLHQAKLDIESSKMACMPAGATEFVGEFDAVTFTGLVEKYLN